MDLNDNRTIMWKVLDLLYRINADKSSARCCDIARILDRKTRHHRSSVIRCIRNNLYANNWIKLEKRKNKLWAKLSEKSIKYYKNIVLPNAGSQGKWMSPSGYKKLLGNRFRIL